MMKIVANQLEGKYCVPDHPITCANPAPWLIEELKIENSFDRDTDTMMWKVWVRGLDSMWFRVDQCFINTIEECQELLRMRATE